MTTTVTKNAQEAGAVADGSPLSSSPIWSLQEKFYSEQGIEAWRSEGIPTLVSTNAHVARVYGEAILAYAEDLGDALDFSEPLNVVELGSGTGKLGFLILKTIERLRPLYPSLAKLKFRYVMTDITERTIEWWLRHPPLTPFLEDGRLDFARWSDADGARIELRRSGLVLEEGSAKNPIVVVANYVLDSLAQDAFHVKGGIVHEARAVLRRDDDVVSTVAPEELEKTEVGFIDRKLEGPYYDEGDLDAVLGSYISMGDASVLFPVAALRALRALASLSGDRMLLLAADKGEAQASSFAGVWDWPLTLHGHCFSLMANLHAIGVWFEHRDGIAFQNPDPRDLFRLTSGILGDGGRPFTAVRRVMERTLEGFSFRDILPLAKAKVAGETEDAEGDIERALSVVKLSGYDPYVFSEVAGDIENGLDGLDEGDRLAIAAIARRVSENDYHLGDHLDLPFIVGRILYQISETDDALVLYKASLAESGEHEATWYNVGLCLECQEKKDEAIEAYERALAIKPGYELAQERLEDLRG